MAPGTWDKAQATDCTLEKLVLVRGMALGKLFLLDEV